MSVPHLKAAASQQLGARVRRVRKSAGVSLRELAARIGLSPATLSQLETGKTRLSVVRLEEIADALGVTAHAILAAPSEFSVESVLGDLDRPPAESSNASVDGSNHITAQNPIVPTPGGGVDEWRVFPPLEFDPVLTAALAEYLEVGYHGTSVRRIARRSGLSVSGIYHYYESKQDMLRGIFDLAMSDILRRSLAARDEGGDAVARFRLLIESLVLFHTYRQNLGLILIHEKRNLELRGQEDTARIRAGLQRIVDSEVEQAVRQRQFHTHSPRGASRAVVNMCIAVAQWYKPQPRGDLSPEAIATDYVLFAMRLMGVDDSQLSTFTPA